MREYIFNFLWTGGTIRGNIIMASWKNLSLPRGWGGWGIKNLSWFSTTLMLKSFWHGLFGNSLWSSVLYGKYLEMNLIDWIRNPKNISRNSTPICRGFMKIYLWIGKDLTWKVGNGKDVMVGIDPILGLGENFQLSPFILSYLGEIGY